MQMFTSQIPGVGGRTGESDVDSRTFFTILVLYLHVLLCMVRIIWEKQKRSAASRIFCLPGTGGGRATNQR